MSVYYQITWLPLCAGLTGLGLVLSYLAWRRRGAAAGLRGAAWSLLPLAAYYLGVVLLLWRLGSAIVSFAGSFVFSPSRWIGVILAGAAALLFTVSGGLRRRRKSVQSGSAGKAAGQAGQPGEVSQPAKAKPKAVAAADDDDLGDVTDILKKHGIR